MTAARTIASEPRSKADILADLQRKQENDYALLHVIFTRMKKRASQIDTLQEEMSR